MREKRMWTEHVGCQVSRWISESKDCTITIHTLKGCTTQEQKQPVLHYSTGSCVFQKKYVTLRALWDLQAAGNRQTTIRN